MKSVYILILLLLCINKSIAQEDFDVLISLGTDIKMMTEPSSKEKPKENTEDRSTALDYELRVFVDYDRFRFGTTFQSQQATHFYKWAIVYDYKFNDFPFRGINTAIGPELGLIKRTQRAHYIKTTNDWLQLGANIDVNYTIPNSNIALGVTYNIYRAEEDMRDLGKNYRQDINFYVSMRLGS